MSDSLRLWTAAHQASLAFTISWRQDTDRALYILKIFSPADWGVGVIPLFHMKMVAWLPQWARLRLDANSVSFPSPSSSTSEPYFFFWVQFGSITQSCLTLYNPMDCSTPGFPVHHQLPELAQTHVHQVGDAIQPSHPLSSPSPGVRVLSNESVLCIRWPKY